jgi:uncharacterized protein YlxW (UPF0749 family)
MTTTPEDDEPTVVNTPRPPRPSASQPPSSAPQPPQSEASEPESSRSEPSARLTPAPESAAGVRPVAGPREASGGADPGPEQLPPEGRPGDDRGEQGFAGDDEPTVRRPLDLGGETVRLRPDEQPGERAGWDTGTAAWDFLASDRGHDDRTHTDREQDDPVAEQPRRELAGSPGTVPPGRGGQHVDPGHAVAVPESGSESSPEDASTDSAEKAAEGGDAQDGAGRGSKVSSASALIAVLLALFGFTIVVQLRSNVTDQGLATARQEDLVRILSDLESRDTRLSAEISALEQSQRQLTSGVAGRQAALAEADKRADELGLLAGTLPGRGPGLKIVIDPKSGQVKASAVLNTVQELRGAGGEVMELAGADGSAVRIVASTYFVDSGTGGIVADGARLTGPYTLWVIGQPQTMQTALQIPGGVVASVESGGGSVTMEQSSLVEVAAVRKATNLQYARPVS